MLTSLISRDMQIPTRGSCHLTPVRVAAIKNQKIRIERRDSNMCSHIRVDSSTLLNSQRAEGTLMCAQGWIFRQNVICTDQGISLSLEKEGNFHTLYGMAGPWGYLYTGGQRPSQKDNTVWSYSYAVLGAASLLETERGIVSAGVGALWWPGGTGH